MNNFPNPTQDPKAVEKWLKENAAKENRQVAGYKKSLKDWDKMPPKEKNPKGK